MPHLNGQGFSRTGDFMKHISVSRIERTAYHEAGHAVAAHLVGREFGSVSIVEDEVSLGRVLFKPYDQNFIYSLTQGAFDDLDDRRKVEGEIVTAFGGEAAVMLLTGKADRKGAASDLSLVRNFVIQMVNSEEEAKAYANWLRHRTRSVLGSDKTWPAVEAVAKALLEHQTLSYDAVRKTTSESFQNRLQDHLAQVGGTK